VTVSGAIYICLAPAFIVTDASNTLGKVECTTHKTALTVLFADFKAYLNDCIACAATGEILVVTSATDSTGYCVDITDAHNTAPCSTATDYL
jgi:hypothetical protein